MKFFEKIDDLPKFSNTWEELQSIMKAQSIQPHGGQLCLNTIPGHENNTYLGTGSLLYNWDEKYYDETGKLFVPEYEHPKKEEDFTVLCDQWKGTVFETIFNAASKKYTFGRVRIMISKPKTCLSWHTDTTNRLHYPIKTQEGCFMVIDDEVCHLTENEWWLTYTQRPHTAFNGSKDNRCHLVFTLLD